MAAVEFTETQLKILDKYPFTRTYLNPTDDLRRSEAAYAEKQIELRYALQAGITSEPIDELGLAEVMVSVAARTRFSESFTAGLEGFMVGVVTSTLLIIGYEVGLVEETDEIARPLRQHLESQGLLISRDGITSPDSLAEILRVGVRFGRESVEEQAHFLTNPKTPRSEALIERVLAAH